LKQTRLKREQFCCKFKGRRLLLNCEYAVRKGLLQSRCKLMGHPGFKPL
jgi:hypothetical protein